MRDIAVPHGVLCLYRRYYFFGASGVVVVVVVGALSLSGAGVVVVVVVPGAGAGAVAGAGAGAGASVGAFLQPTANTASSMSERTIANTFFIRESPPSNLIWSQK